MQIWMDGDACPKAIKNILYAAAMRTKTPLFIVANHFISHPPSPYIKSRMVPSGFDVADNKILESMSENDLVITADIPLANAVVDKNGLALNPRGKLYTQENIKEVLAMRNLNQSLRDSGLISGGAGVLSKKEIQAFANNLDKIITQFN